MAAYRFIFFLLFSFLFSNQIEAQQRFKAGIIAGLNASQINGDASAGYNKVGLVGGLRGVSILSNKMELSIELLFSQQGSRTELTTQTIANQYAIHLNYAAVPIIFNYLDWEQEDYHRIHFHGGLAYSRLLSVNVTDPDYDLVANEFNDNDISILGGITYYLNRKIGLTARYTRSLTLLFNNNKVTSINANSLVGYFLTFHGVYMF